MRKKKSEYIEKMDGKEPFAKDLLIAEISSP